MKSVDVLESLKQILEEKEPIKIKLIKEFQSKIWNDESITDEIFNGIVTELAYDMDFYEPNKKLREEDNSYYDNDKLTEIVRAGIKRIEQYKL